MAVHIDDLLIEQIALEEEKALIFGQWSGLRGLAELHSAIAWTELRDLGDQNQGRLVVTLGGGQLEDDAVNMSASTRRRTASSRTWPKVLPVGVGDGRPHEG